MEYHDRRSTQVADPIERRRTDGDGYRPAPRYEEPERRSQTLASSVARHPFIVLLPAILLLAAGIVVGGKKHPTYSAAATINVGKADIATQATPGYVQASEALAASYSRLVTSQR